MFLSDGERRGEMGDRVSRYIWRAGFERWLGRVVMDSLCWYLPMFLYISSCYVVDLFKDGRFGVGGEGCEGVGMRRDVDMRDMGKRRVGIRDIGIRDIGMRDIGMTGIRYKGCG